ncbi:hypothetical protein [Polymorphospora sp. NPDC050346]|uniref:hypothetical protein n=1 Tax=Polymorphospora sp. NPDC050346 TaxID=3155780 RepID=UPI0033E805A1
MTPEAPSGAQPPEPRKPPAYAAAVDLALRVVGGVLAVVAALLTAVLELLFATVRVGGHLIGVSALIALVGNLALSWFAYRAVGKRWAVALPALTWFAIMVVAAGRTDEGDLLLTGDNWVGLATIVTGSMAFAIMGFRLILSPAR